MQPFTGKTGAPTVPEQSTGHTGAQCRPSRPGRRSGRPGRRTVRPRQTAPAGRHLVATCPVPVEPNAAGRHWSSGGANQTRARAEGRDWASQVGLEAPKRPFWRRNLIMRNRFTVTSILYITSRFKAIIRILTGKTLFNDCIWTVFFNYNK